MDGGASVEARSTSEGGHHLGKVTRSYIRRVSTPTKYLQRSWRHLYLNNIDCGPFVNPPASGGNHKHRGINAHSLVEKLHKEITTIIRTPGTGVRQSRYRLTRHGAWSTGCPYFGLAEVLPSLSPLLFYRPSLLYPSCRFLLFSREGCWKRTVVYRTNWRAGRELFVLVDSSSGWSMTTDLWAKITTMFGIGRVTTSSPFVVW